MCFFFTDALFCISTKLISRLEVCWVKCTDMMYNYASCLQITNYYWFQPECNCHWVAFNFAVVFLMKTWTHLLYLQMLQVEVLQLAQFIIRMNEQLQNLCLAVDCVWIRPPPLRQMWSAEPSHPLPQIGQDQLLLPIPK